MADPATLAKKENFKTYLESTGVIDALTKVLVGLYEEPEKPADALTFIREALSQSSIEIDILKRENQDLRKQNEELKAELELVRAQLSSLQPSDAS